MDWKLVKNYSDLVIESSFKQKSKISNKKRIKSPIVFDLKNVPHFSGAPLEHTEFRSSGRYTSKNHGPKRPEPAPVESKIRNNYPQEPCTIEGRTLNKEKYSIPPLHTSNDKVLPSSADHTSFEQRSENCKDKDKYKYRNQRSVDDNITYRDQTTGVQGFDKQNEIQAGVLICSRESNPCTPRQLLQNTDNTTGYEEDISPENSHPQNLWNGCFSWDEEIKSLNRTIFNHQDFKPNQREIINAVLSKEDVLGCLPTGGGKSLVFQLPSLMMEGITVVLMPLDSLIKDHYQKLLDYNIPAEIITIDEQRKQVLHDIVTKRGTKILLITIELLIKSEVIRKLLKELDARKRINFFVVDEAHCIENYDKSFLIDLSRLKFLRNDFAQIPILCLTSCITASEKRDIIADLQIHPVVISGASYRSNLIYEVIPKAKKDIKQIASLIKTRFKDQTGIIIINNQQNCEDYSAKLTREYSVSCTYSHGGLPNDKKNSNFQDWREGKYKVIMTTRHYCLGIDNKQVRFVIHYKLPKSISDFYQESGRAGRDSAEAHCIIMYDINDRISLYYLQKSYKKEQRKIQGMKNMYEILEFCEDVCSCRKKSIGKCFGETEVEDCRSMCDNCRVNYSGGVYIEEKNFTMEAQKMLDFVNSDEALRKGLTFLKFSNFFSGKSLESRNASLSNSIKSLSSEEINKIFLKLLKFGYLYEQRTNDQSYYCLYPSEDKQNISDHDLVIFQCRTNAIPSKSGVVMRKELSALSPDKEKFGQIIYRKAVGNANDVRSEDLGNGDNYGNCRTEEAFNRLKNTMIGRAIELEITFDIAFIEKLCRELPMNDRKDEVFLEVISKFLLEDSNNRNAISSNEHEVQEINLPIKRGRSG